MPNYTYLKLKIPGPRGVITVRSDFQQANLYDRESCDLATTVIRSQEILAIQKATKETALDFNKGSTSGAFKPAEDTKVVQVDPEDTTKTVRIGSMLTGK